MVGLHRQRNSKSAEQPDEFDILKAFPTEKHIESFGAIGNGAEILIVMTLEEEMIS